MASYKLKNKNAPGMMASSPLYINKPDPADYDMTDEGDKNLYQEKLDSWHRSQQKGSEIKGSQISEKGTSTVKGAMQGSTGPNVQFGGDGRRILKPGGGNVGASSGTGGGKNENVTGISISPRVGSGGVGSGLTSSFAGLGKLGTTFKPDPLVIPPPATKNKKTDTKKDKKVTKPTETTGTGTNTTKTKVKKGPASTSIKPMEGLVDLGGSDSTQNISKVRATVDAARSSSNDLIQNKLDGGGRVGRVRRRQQKRTANLEKRLQNRADIRGIRQNERGKRSSMRESASQERKNLLMDNPVAKDASGGRKSSQPQQPKATQESKMSRKTKRQLKRSDKFSASLSGATNKNLKSGGSQDFRGMKGDKSSKQPVFDYSQGKNKYKKDALGKMKSKDAAGYMSHGGKKDGVGKMSRELTYGGPVIDQMGNALSHMGAMKVLKHNKSRM